MILMLNVIMVVIIGMIIVNTLKEVVDDIKFVVNEVAKKKGKN